MKRLLPILICFGFTSVVCGQSYWQQEAHYQMDIDFDSENHQFDGAQELTFTNHSPDTLNKVFYHLYFNAFQPGSMMDVRSRNIPDASRKIGSRIYGLSDKEIGYQKEDLYALKSHQDHLTVLRLDLTV